ncbi:10505_t:CDS:2, partial [Paraglomus occultum]
ISSEQIADTERGFSYRQDAPLDMRMDERNKLTAQDIVNFYSYQKLLKIFSDYGEERKAKKIAERICQYRRKEKITTTQQLVKIIVGCQTAKSKKHPARRVFQALRIAVNQELVVTKKPLVASGQEVNENRRARSAKMRCKKLVGQASIEEEPEEEVTEITELGEKLSEELLQIIEERFKQIEENILRFEKIV